MVKLTVQLFLSKQKLAQWMGNEIGIRNADLPDDSAAQQAIISFLEKNEVAKGVENIKVTSFSIFELRVILAGEDERFRKACQLLENHFESPK
jgi:hypothetical protein